MIGWYVRAIPSPRCERCAAPAIVTLYTPGHCARGSFCGPCGAAEVTARNQEQAPAEAGPREGSDDQEHST